MGWTAFTKEGEIIREGEQARPVQAGEEGQLLAITQEDMGHRIAVDLTAGVIFFDYENIGINQGYLEVSGYKTMLYICDETTRLGGLMDQKWSEEADESGLYLIDYVPYTWRPIWFTRFHNGQPTWVIGAQTTIDGRNFKKMISIFVDGTLGID